MFLLLAYLASRCIKLSHWTPSRLYGGTVSPPAQGSLQACPTKAGLPALRFHFWRVPSRIRWVVCPFDLPQAKQGWFLVQSPFLKGRRAICPHLWLGNLPKSSLTRSATNIVSRVPPDTPLSSASGELVAGSRTTQGGGLGGITSTDSCIEHHHPVNHKFIPIEMCSQGFRRLPITVSRG